MLKCDVLFGAQRQVQQEESCLATIEGFCTFLDENTHQDSRLNISSLQ